MTTAVPNSAQLAGGRLFYGVDDATIVAPYGGTELGLVASVFVVPPLGVIHLPMEEDGSTTRTIYIGGDAVAGALLPTFDANAVAALYPGAATGTEGGPIIAYPGKVGQTGEVLTNLLFVPTNPAHNAWLMPLAQPATDEQSRLWFSHRRWLRFPVIFRSHADASGRALITGTLADLATLVAA